MSSTVTVADIALKSVLVAFDFSEASRKPLLHALAIARHYGAKFYLAHVVSGIGYTIAGQETFDLAAERSRRTAQELEKGLLESGALAGLDHEFIIREGGVWEQLELLIREKQIDMVVVGTHGRGALGKLLLGSVAEQVFRHADCLVATVRPGSSVDSLVEKTKPIRPFLFPTDFGPASLHALPYAVSLANHFAAKLVVLHVLPVAPIPESFHWSTTGDLTQMRDEARIASQRQFDSLNLQHTQMAIQPEFMVKYGTPGEQILLASHALKADLIVLGLHHPRHIEAGSHMPWHLAYKVVCDAHCPVLTIRN
jgi:nucleotide-binding universal stress UspA family protein